MDAAEIIRLEDILANARLAQGFIGSLTKEQFIGDKLRIYAVVRAIEIVGEAATCIAPERRAMIGAIPWRNMIDIRNRLIHGYQTVRAEVIYDTVRDKFPPLIVELEKILSERPTNGS
ncbi:MAG: DUF86 domain-containing protein [Parvularculaceae bacterium]